MEIFTCCPNKDDTLKLCYSDTIQSNGTILVKQCKRILHLFIYILSQFRENRRTGLRTRETDDEVNNLNNNIK